MLRLTRDSLRKLFSLVGCVVVVSMLGARLVSAQSTDGIEPGETAEQPKERTTQITAGVFDREAPSTPILISPEDGTRLKINKPTLVWQESTDNFMVTHYELFLNGSSKFATIPLVDTTTDDYTLTYDSTTGYYTLVFLKSLSDGSYTWRITATDIQDNVSSSVTWDFSIDTTAPSFVISEIEDLEVEITTSDNSSVPADPIELKENEPELKGTGESNSTVKLTLTFADGSTKEITFTINSSGEWEVTLDTLPRDEIIELDFQITDETGNVSLLSDLKLIVRTPVVIIPLPVIPPLIPRQPAEEPPAPPQIVIPVVPPAEYIPPVIRKLPKQMVFYVKSYTATVREYSVSVLDKLWFMSVALLLLLLPLLKLGFLSFLFRHFLSGSMLQDFLWIIGLGTNKPPQGIAVSVTDQQPASYSLVHYSGKNNQKQVIKRACVSNEAGIFLRTNLENGEYRASLQHSGYSFPVLGRKPDHLTWNQYYVGVPFTVNKADDQPLLVIPGEPVKNPQNTGFERFKVTFLGLPSVNIPLAILSACLCLAFPSVVNWLSLSVYASIYVHKELQKKRTGIDVFVGNAQGEPLRNIIVTHRPLKHNTYTQITQTNEFGLTRQFIKPSEVQIEVVGFKQRLTEGDKKTRVKIKHDASDKYLPFILN